mmetsp:Transcript_14157/g.16950  ORF Transcript_14157/g.16950 Transcript_14157/m.16950 type:complete len:336 (-) Transcript_14157:106-1113(-)
MQHNQRGTEMEVEESETSTFGRMAGQSLKNNVNFFDSKAKCKSLHNLAETPPKAVTTVSRTQCSQDIQHRLLDSAAGLKILCDPFVHSDQLLQLAFESSCDFVREYGKQWFSQNKEPVVLNILQGGRYYALDRAINSVYGKTPTTVSLCAKRKYSPAEGKWKVNIFNEDLKKLEAMSESVSSIVIGDTIATGTTLKGVIDHVLRLGIVGSETKIIVYSIAGTFDRLQWLDDYPNVSVVVSNVDLHLHDNGTDLQFGGKARFTKKAREYVDDVLGREFSENHVKCAIFDWGDRFRNPKEHLEEVLEYYESLSNTTSLPSYFQELLQKYSRSLQSHS